MTEQTREEKPHMPGSSPWASDTGGDLPYEPSFPDVDSLVWLLVRSHLTALAQLGFYSIWDVRLKCKWSLETLERWWMDLIYTDRQGDLLGTKNEREGLRSDFHVALEPQLALDFGDRSSRPQHSWQGRGLQRLCRVLWPQKTVPSSNDPIGKDIHNPLSHHFYSSFSIRRKSSLKTLA